MSSQAKIPNLYHCNFCVSFHPKLFYETKIKSATEIRNLRSFKN